MWDWAHFKEEGWIAHTKRSIRLALLLFLAANAMILHSLVPFWQQPKSLRRDAVARALCEGLEPHKE
jgi:hypothetical protein